MFNLTYFSSITSDRDASFDARQKTSDCMTLTGMGALVSGVLLFVFNAPVVASMTIIAIGFVLFSAGVIQDWPNDDLNTTYHLS